MPAIMLMQVGSQSLSAGGARSLYQKIESRRNKSIGAADSGAPAAATSSEAWIPVSTHASGRGNARRGGWRWLPVPAAVFGGSVQRINKNNNSVSDIQCVSS